MRPFSIFNRPINQLATTGKEHYYLSFNNRPLSKALAKQGCMSAKTFKLVFPNIPTHLHHHFVRGYFDGDGCIHRRKNSDNYVVHILGTKAFMKGMSEIAPVDFYVKQRSKNTIWYGGIYKKADIIKFEKWLYQDATIWMERKRNKFPKNK